MWVLLSDLAGSQDFINCIRSHYSDTDHVTDIHNWANYFILNTFIASRVVNMDFIDCIIHLVCCQIRNYLNNSSNLQVIYKLIV